MAIVPVLLLSAQRPDPSSIISELIGHYEKLKTYSAVVVHHGDFVSDVKDSTDAIAWYGPMRFEIESNKPSNPKLTSDGRKLTTYIPGVAPISENLQNSQRKIASWETRGGIILSLLMRGQMADEMLRPKKPVKVTYSYGKTLQWHDVPVSEVIEVISLSGVSETVSYYLSPNYKTLIGVEVASGPESSWTQYTNILENPPLSKTLGAS